MEVFGQKGWTTRHILIVLAVLATLAVATTVVGGSTFLLFSPILIPLLLLFSPILIPLFIATVVIGGGTLFVAAGITAAVWVYRYAAGQHPWGSQPLDELFNAVKGLQQQAAGVGRVTESSGQMLQRYVGYPMEQASRAMRTAAEATQPQG